MLSSTTIVALDQQDRRHTLGPVLDAADAATIHARRESEGSAGKDRARQQHHGSTHLHAVSIGTCPV